MVMTKEHTELGSRSEVREPPVRPEASPPGYNRFPVARPWSDRLDRLSETIDRRSSAVVGLAWLLLLPLAMAVEPGPADPTALAPWYAELSALVLVGMLLAMVPHLVLRKRGGPALSLGAAALLLVGTIACPVTGHHAFGAWWLVQLACALTLVGVSGAAVRGARRS